MAIFIDPGITPIADPLLFTGYTAQLPELVAGLSAQDMEQIERIFLYNLASGRAQRVRGRWMIRREAPVLLAPLSWTNLAVDEQSDWQLSYLRQIIQIYRWEGARLHALAQGNDEAWRILGVQLTESASHLLLHKGFDAPFAADLALDMAQQTCHKIYMSIFPCDVAFNIWAHVILKHQILHQLTRSTELLDRQRYIESFESLQAEYEDRYSCVPIGWRNHNPWDVPFFASKQIEDREWLIGAIAQLPSLERRAVLVYTYFYELSDEEIAQHLGKSKGAVHTLRHRALKQLQGILEDCL